MDFYGSDGSDTRFDRAPWADNHPAAGDKAFTGEAGFNEGLLQHESGARTLVLPGGIEWKTDNKLWGVPTEIVDPGGEGNSLSLSYYYDSHGEHLEQVKDTHGHTLKITREAETHRITKIEGKKGEAWKYAYKEGRLITVTNPAKEKAKYTYYKSGAASGLLESIDDESGTWVVVYDESKRVSSLRKLVNGTVKKAGSEDDITSFSYETEQTTVTNPEGEKPIFYYDEFGNVLEEPATQEAASEFYAAYAEIEAGAARKDIDLQDHASVLDSQLSQQLGPNYTGEWFAPTSEKPLRLGRTSEGYEKTIEQDLDNLGLADNAEIVPSSASVTQLEEAETTLRSSLAELLAGHLVRIGIVASGDAVTVLKANSLTSAQTKHVEEAVGALSVPVKVTTAEATSLVAEPHSCFGGACSRPLRGGVQIILENEVHKKLSNCTAGFIARSLSDNKPYVLTAGHCVLSHFGDTWSSEAYSEKLKEEGPEEETGLFAIGRGHSYIFGASHEVPGATAFSKIDAGLIAIEPKSFWANPLEPIVVVYPGAETTFNGKYGIIGTHYSPRQPSTEFVVCGSGVPGTIAHHQAVADCGLIQGRQDVGYPAQEVQNLVVVEMCAHGHVDALREGGDSGSPWVKDHRAYGIESGGEDPCKEYYQNIETAELELHVTVQTEIRG